MANFKLQPSWSLTNLKLSSTLPYLYYLFITLIIFFIGYRAGQTSSLSSFLPSITTSSSQVRTYPIPKLSPKEYQTVMMDPPEVDTVLKYLPRDGTYLEWGAGGSTLIYPKFVKRAISIEHVESWCEHLRQKQKANQLPKNVELHCIPIKKRDGSGEYFINQNEGDYETFKEYVDILSKIGVKKGEIDFVLVDGRARVATALRVLPYLKEGSVVAVHDTELRPRLYSEILNHYDLIDRGVGKREKRGISIYKRKDKYRGGKGLPIGEEYIHEYYRKMPKKWNW